MSATLSFPLPYGRSLLLDALPKLRRGEVERRWLVLGRMPSPRGVRPTLAAGALRVVDGRMTVDRGCASLELLEHLRCVLEGAPTASASRPPHTR
jgi:hypothetical protein